VTPPALDRLVRRCLAKDPEDRWQNARDLASELRWIQESGATAARAEIAKPPWWSIAWMAAAVAVLAIGVAGALWMRSSAAAEPPAWAGAAVRFEVASNEGTTMTSAPIVSSDGRSLAWLESVSKRCLLCH